MTVHNHGPAEGPGLGCPERTIDGSLRGACLTDPGPVPGEPDPYCDHGPFDACRCLAPKVIDLTPDPQTGITPSIPCAGDNLACDYPEPHDHGFACNRRCPCWSGGHGPDVETLVVGPPAAPTSAPSPLAAFTGLQVRAHLGAGDQIAAIVKDHDGKVLGYIAQAEVDRLRNMPSASEVNAYAVAIERMLRGPSNYAEASPDLTVPEEWRAWCPTCSEGFGPVVPMLARNWATIHNEGSHGGRGNGGRPW